MSKAAGDEVIGATLNRTGSRRRSAPPRSARTPRSPRSSGWSRTRRAPRRRCSAWPTRVSAFFVPAVLVAAVLTFAGWALFGPEPAASTMAIGTTIAVLIIACPCALGLATPTAIMVGTGKAAELGILIGDGEALEQASRITTIVLDKTGTITRGRPGRHRDRPRVRLVRRTTLLALAAAAETGSEHPLGEAIVAAARERGLAAARPPRPSRRSPATASTPPWSTAHGCWSATGR